MVDLTGLIDLATTAFTNNYRIQCLDQTVSLYGQRMKYSSPVFTGQQYIKSAVSAC